MAFLRMRSAVPKFIQQSITKEMLMDFLLLKLEILTSIQQFIINGAHIDSLHMRFVVLNYIQQSITKETLMGFLHLISVKCPTIDCIGPVASPPAADPCRYMESIYKDQKGG